MDFPLRCGEGAGVPGEFRSIVRGLSPDHGIRVGKWLGDGCMFVGTEVRPVVETVLDLTEQMEDADLVLPLRIGIAAGKVIVFEGDDFIGMSINLASRLCDAAAPSEILGSQEVIDALDGDFPVVPLGERVIPGIVAPVAVWRIDSGPELHDELPLSFAE